MGLYRILYRSKFYENVTVDEISEMVEKASDKNLGVGISGVLLMDDTNCMQVLEGEEEDVKDLFYKRIYHDRRHGRVRVISEGPIEQKLFNKWGMGFGYMTNSSKGVNDDIILELLQYFEETGDIELDRFWNGKSKK